MWRKKLELDGELPGEISKVWKGGKMEPNISQVKIDRCYHHLGWQYSDIYLYIFCDPSESAYGAANCLRFAFKGGSFHCCFIMGKT